MIRRFLPPLIFFFSFTYVDAQTPYWEKIGAFWGSSDVKVNSSEDIFIVEQGHMQRSTDNGVTWNEINIPGAGSIQKISISGTDHIYVCDYGIEGKIYISSDKGVTWTYSTTNAGVISYLYAGTQGIVYAGNLNGIVLKSTDTGLNWSSHTITNVEIRCIVSGQDGRMYAASKGNGVFTSTDAGVNWEQTEFDSGNVRSVCVNDSGFVFITEVSKVYLSKDHGSNWTEIGYYPAGEGVVGSDSSGAVYACFYAVFKTTDNGESWLNMGGPYFENCIASYGEKLYLATIYGTFRYKPGVFPPNFYASNFVPLNFGNKWQYLDNWANYTLRISYVESDTIIVGNTYYKFSGDNKWLRYDQSQKILFLWNDSDRISVDFSKYPDQIYRIYAGYTYEDVTAAAGTVFFIFRGKSICRV